MQVNNANPVVFLVDDDPAVRSALSRVLREEGFDVHAYPSAEAFLERPDPSSYGCIVLDVSMPGLDGLALQQQLSSTGVTLPIVFLSGHADIPMTVSAIKGGAADFLTKPVGSAQLVEAVRNAMTTCEFAQREYEALTELLRRFATLTPREREVLDALVEGKLNKQIAADLGVVEQTVKFHRARVMERMQARTVAELMHMAARLGATRMSRHRPEQKLQPPLNQGLVCAATIGSNN